MNHLPLEPRPRPQIIAFICPHFHGEQQRESLQCSWTSPKKSTVHDVGLSWWVLEALEPWCCWITPRPLPGGFGSPRGTLRSSWPPQWGASILPVRHSREQRWLAAVKKTSVCANVALTHFLRGGSSPPSVGRNQEGPDAQQRGASNSCDCPRSCSSQLVGVYGRSGASQLSSLSLFHSFQEPQNQTGVS